MDNLDGNDQLPLIPKEEHFFKSPQQREVARKIASVYPKGVKVSSVDSRVLKHLVERKLVVASAKKVTMTELGLEAVSNLRSKPTSRMPAVRKIPLALDETEEQLLSVMGQVTKTLLPLSPAGRDRVLKEVERTFNNNA